ncbi:MAG: hypothetical protein V4850_03840 [Myxococcota bacterium]
MALLGLPAAAVQLDGAWMLGGISAVLATASAGAVSQFTRQKAERARLEIEDRAVFEQAETDRRAQHDKEQAHKGQEHAAEEGARGRLRAALDSGDPQALAELLHVELLNEDFPVPVVAEAEFDGLTIVEIEVTLPELDDVPEDRPNVLASGKLSRKKIAAKDRVSIYEDLRRGIALRLAYETLRVLPTVQRVRCRGTFTETGPRGEDVERVALLLDLERAQLGEIDLDRADPSTALRALGKFGCTKKGELREVG